MKICDNLLILHYDNTTINLPNRLSMINRQIWPDDVQPVENLEFQPVEPIYTRVLTARIILSYIIFIGLAFIILAFEESYRWWILLGVEAILVIALVINLVLVHKIYDFKGYALRDKDISYRSGIFFTSVKTVPFSKIQQVSVRTNPIARMFGLSYLDIVNGSQSSVNQITIPGLTSDDAERIKALLINKDCCDE